MHTLRKLIAVVAAMSFAALALPAGATFNNDYYKLVMTSGTVPSGPQPVTATITNKAPFDFLKSFTITAPAGVTINTVVSASSSIPQNKISFTPTKITVGPILIAYNHSGALSITATSQNCGINLPLAWTSTAKGGLIVSNEVFTLTADSSLKPGLSYLGTLALQFVTPPATVDKDVAFPVTVARTSSCGAAVTLPEVPVTLSGAPAFTVGTPQPANTVGGVATISGNKFGQVGAASMTATSPGYANATANLHVATTSAGSLECANPDGSGNPDATFNGTPAGQSPSDPNLPAYLEGFRIGPIDETNCPPLALAIFNNVNGTGAITTPKGLLPAGFAALQYPPLGANQAIRQTITFPPEASAASGLPDPNRKFVYCADTACTTKNDAQACNGSALSPFNLAALIPGTEKGCLIGFALMIVPDAVCTGHVPPGRPRWRHPELHPASGRIHREAGSAVGPQQLVAIRHSVP